MVGRILTAFDVTRNTLHLFDLRFTQYRADGPKTQSWNSWPRDADDKTKRISPTPQPRCGFSPAGETTLSRAAGN